MRLIVHGGWTALERRPRGRLSSLAVLLRVREIVAQSGRVAARVSSAEGVCTEVDVADHLEHAALPGQHEVEDEAVLVVTERGVGGREDLAVSRLSSHRLAVGRARDG